MPPPDQVTFNDIKERLWKLAELRIGAGTVTMNRQDMEAAGQGDIFILQFSDEGLNGKAAPNRYFGPYLSREGKNVSVRPIMGTRMASLSPINIGGITEDEYYWYINRVVRWDIQPDGRLALFAKGSQDETYTLLFVQ
jgi:heat shock protein HslJ